MGPVVAAILTLVLSLPRDGANDAFSDGGAIEAGLGPVAAPVPGMVNEERAPEGTVNMWPPPDPSRRLRGGNRGLRGGSADAGDKRTGSSRVRAGTQRGSTATRSVAATAGGGGAGGGGVPGMSGNTNAVFLVADKRPDAGPPPLGRLRALPGVGDGDEEAPTAPTEGGEVGEAGETDVGGTGLPVFKRIGWISSCEARL
jgi:hypothetical protein